MNSPSTQIAKGPTQPVEPQRVDPLGPVNPLTLAIGTGLALLAAPFFHDRHEGFSLRPHAPTASRSTEFHMPSIPATPIMVDPVRATGTAHGQSSNPFEGMHLPARTTDAPPK